MGRERYSEEEQAFYRRYLNSPAWKAYKQRRLGRAGGRCEFETLRLVPGRGFVPERCRRARYLCVHHNTYDRLGAEQDGDTDVFCWAHHMLEHLLWKRCPLCAGPCLLHDEYAEQWLTVVLSTMGIDLDAGPVDWRRLPNKEVLLDMTPKYCPNCVHLVAKDEP